MVPMMSDPCFRCGVYVIVCNPTGRIYIGSSVHILKRWKKHLWELGRGVHHSQVLQRAWAKYGPAAFSFHAVAECMADQRLELEQFYMDYLAPSFNVAEVAGTCQGVLRSAEQRAELSKRMLAMSPSERASRLEKMRETMATDEFKAKRSQQSKKQWVDPIIGARNRAKLAKVRVDFSEKIKAGVRRSFSEPDRLRRHLEMTAARSETTNWRENHLASQRRRRSVSEQDVLRIRTMRKAGSGAKAISELTGVKYTTVKNIISGNCYKDVSE